MAKLRADVIYTEMIIAIRTMDWDYVFLVINDKLDYNPTASPV